MSNQYLISVVVPVYKEQDSIEPFLNRIVPVLEKMGTYEIIFCLDPSPDNTENIIRKQISLNPCINLLVFSRRFGQPMATMAGILNCRGDYCAVIDVDLQDPPELIEALYRKTLAGFDVVSAQRQSRKGETIIKKIVSSLGYKLINKLSDIEIPTNTGDFRIISRRVIEELRKLKESHGFLRGLVSLVGFKQTTIPYRRAARDKGESKYNPLLGSVKIGFNGVVGFSTGLLTVMLWVGVLFAFLSFLGAIFVFITKLIYNNYPMGTPTMAILLLFMGGIQLISIGIVGQYIGRIYDEVRNRPKYIIDYSVNSSNVDSQNLKLNTDYHLIDSNNV